MVGYLLFLFFYFCSCVRLFLVDNTGTLLTDRVSCSSDAILQNGLRVYTMSRSAVATDRQSEILEFVCSRFSQTGMGVSMREISAHFKFGRFVQEGGAEIFKVYPNGAKCHIDALVKKGLIEVNYIENADGTKKIRPNSIRPIGSNPPVEPVEMADCRSGSGYCFAIINNGENILFTLFRGIEIVQNDILPIEKAITFCDNLKIDSELPVIDRLELLAQRQAKRLN